MILSFINHSWLSVARGSQGKTVWERRYVVLVRDRLNVYFSENGAGSIEPEYGKNESNRYRISDHQPSFMLV